MLQAPLGFRRPLFGRLQIPGTRLCGIRLHADHAQEIVTHAAPGLQRVLNEALAEGGWFGGAHEAQLSQAAAFEDPDERLRMIRTLVADETRLGMLVGVAVGLELAHELMRSNETGDER